MSTSSEAFRDMTAAEAERFMAGNAHPIREAAAAKISIGPVHDLGCGRGIRIAELYTAGQYIGVDCSPALIAVAKRDNPGYSFVVADIVEYLAGLQTKSLTNALMVSVLEHVPSLAAAQAIYREARRVARTLYVGWHTPPRFAETVEAEVQAELDRPIWQNRYKAGSFNGAVDVQRIRDAELWTVRD